jgi:ATP-dependent Clp protease ATP-binding subunit ClpA
LASKGYDSQYGARPLKRVIQREIENILAEKILRGELVDGQNVKLNYDNEVLGFLVENNVVKV